MVEKHDVNAAGGHGNIPELPEIGWFLITTLQVDESYQHGVHPPAIAHLLKGFDPAVSGFILVNIRADGSMWIIDGQTRWAVHSELHIPYIRAEVLRGLTDVEEARVYMLKCRNTQHVPLDFLRAERKAGVREVLLMFEILEKRQIRVSRESRGERGIEGYNSIACIGTLRRLLRRDPDGEILGDTLDLIIATWGYTEGALTQQNIESIFLLLSIHKSKVKQQTFVEKFRDIPLAALGVEAKKKQLATTPPGTLTMARRCKLEELYDLNLPDAKRLCPKKVAA